MIISILTRTLREGKTLEDFRAAWERQGGFGVPTRVVTGQGLENPREIVTIGFSDLEVDEIEGFLARTAPEEARHRDLHRLLLRASLDDQEAGGGVGADDLDDLRRRQDAGELTRRLDPAFVLLALEAIASAPLVFPADVRRLTGRDPASDDFAVWHAAQLRTLVELLAER